MTRSSEESRIVDGPTKTNLLKSLGESIVENWIPVELKIQGKNASYQARIISIEVDIEGNYGLPEEFWILKGYVRISFLGREKFESIYSTRNQTGTFKLL